MRCHAAACAKAHYGLEPKKHITFALNLVSTLSPPAIMFADHAAPCCKALGRKRLPHSLGDLRSELAIVSPWQFAGEKRLQSTAMTLITSVAAIGIGSAVRKTFRRLVLLLADRISKPVCTVMLAMVFSASRRASQCFGRINLRSFLSSPLIVVGKCLKLTCDRLVGHASGSAKQSPRRF